LRHLSIRHWYAAPDFTSQAMANREAESRLRGVKLGGSHTSILQSRQRNEKAKIQYPHFDQRKLFAEQVGSNSPTFNLLIKLILQKPDLIHVAGRLQSANPYCG
jgi:hypothetical protein